MRPTDLPPECLWALEAIFEDRAHEESPDDAARLHSHVNECSDCRTAADWDRRLAHLLEADAGPPAPPSVLKRTRELSRRRSLRRWGAWGAAAAAVLIAVGVTLYAVRGGHRPRTVAPAPVADVEGIEWIAATPVDPLAVLDREQRALLAALEQEL